MKQKDQVWWVSATVVSLAAFSFFAGSGMRGLMIQLGSSARADEADKSYPKYASAAPRGLGADVDLKPMELYEDVLRKLRLYYVEPLPADTTLAYGSIEAMLNSLNDPNSRLISKAEMEALRGAPNGEYPGLGALLTIRRYATAKVTEAEAAAADEDEAPARKNGKEKAPSLGTRAVTVVSVAPDSPAAKAGLQPGDRITEIDGRWIAPMHVSYRVLTQLTDDIGLQDGPPREKDELPPVETTPEERARMRKEADEARARWKSSTDLAAAMELLNGPLKGEHELTVERGKPVKTLKVRVAAGRGNAPVFATRKIDGTTGYVQIRAFNSNTPQDLADVLEDYAKQGVKNLVLDLRGSAGGSLEAARDTAGVLLGDVKFAVLKERDENRKLVDRAVMIKSAPGTFKPAAVSVLVDGGTAGSSELFAAALRDHAGARLVGRTTFGDGTEQELVRLENGAGLSLTRAKMLTSKGVDFDQKGLQPDVAAPGDAMEAAVKALAGPNTVRK